MAKVPIEDGLHIVPGARSRVELWREDGVPQDDGLTIDGELEALRDAFVAAFNGRDLDSLVGIVHPEVECPDAHGDGVAVLAEEVESIWERSPGAILTPALLEESPCAVAWLPDEDGCWSRAALVCLEHADSLLTLVTAVDDADALDRVETADPTGEELDEWSDWAEWERGEETVPGQRDEDG